MVMMMDAIMEGALVGCSVKANGGLVTARVARASASGRKISSSLCSRCGEDDNRLDIPSSSCAATRKRVVYRCEGLSSFRVCASSSAPGLCSVFRGRKTLGRRELFGIGFFHSGGALRRCDSGSGNGGLAGRSSCYALASAAFPSITKTERTLALPIDYYQILGAETHFLADGIVRAYEARLAHPPKEGFSQEALLARAEILRGARDTLADPEWRGDYNQGLVEDEAGTLVVDVPWSKVAGALCLLQEVGEMEVVLEAGQGLLEERLPKAMRRDVVLSMALAYVELSREAMAEAVPAVVRSCDLLETALKLIQEEGGRSLAAELQEQIEETLEELTPRCVLELLASPLDKEHETQREEGLQGLKSILWAVGEGGAAAPIRAFTREQFIKDAFSFLTASEQVALWNATPDNVPAESFEVYAVALAHVAQGYTSKKPILIVKADELLWQLQTSMDSDGEVGLPLDYSLERAMCWLLMGEVDQSMACLGLVEGSEDFRDPSVIEFVYSHSEGSEDGDLLPGLCKLLENWLAEVVFPTFRDTETLQVRLGDYYDDSQVITILEQWETTKGGSSSALSRIGAALDSVKASAVQTFQKVFPLGNRAGSSQVVRRDKDRSLTSMDGEHDAFDSNSVGAASIEGTAPASGFVPSASMLSTRLGYSWGDTDVGGGPGASSGKNNGAVLPARRGGLTPVQIACSGIVFGALVMAGLRFLPLQGGTARLSGRTSAVATTASSSGAVQERQAVEVTKMDARVAEHMVRKWQTAKARALGASHSVSHLPEVLEGKMLESWTDRVNEVARNGWYWEYRLVGLNIDSVTVSDDGRKAIVEATLQEAARLFDSKNPEHKDSYRSTYTTRYELQYGENGWRITGGVVLRS
ncbi:unnamed protein product [Calypogeia fissa]